MNDKILTGIKETIFFSKKFFFYIIAILLFLYVFSGTYSISQNQLGVVQVFGRVTNDRVMPGIHFTLPWPVSRVSKIPVKTVSRISIDDFSEITEYNSPTMLLKNFTGLNPYCITGDNNIVNLSCGIQYSINDPIKYVFNVRMPEVMLREIACNTIIHCLAMISVDEVLTYGKRQMESYIKNEMQAKLNDLDCGLDVSFVEFNKVEPPEIVQEYFNDVINSKIDKKKITNSAESYWNEKIPEANAGANRLIEEAESYQKDVISKAIGDSERFLSMLKIYRNVPDITRKRLYLEYIKDILAGIDEKYIISAGNNKPPAKLKLYGGKDASE